MQYIYMMTDLLRYADSEGYPIDIGYKHLTFGNYGNVNVFVDATVRWDETATTVKPDLNVDVYFEGHDINGSPGSTQYQNHLPLRVTVEVSTDNFSTITTSKTVTDTSTGDYWQPWFGLQYYGRVQSGVGRYKSYSPSGSATRLGRTITCPLNFTKRAFQFRVKVEYKPSVGGSSWITAGTSNSFKSYSPFRIGITKPGTFYMNGVNRFTAAIGAEFTSSFERSLTAISVQQQYNVNFASFDPVRTETAPYITSGTATNYIWWLPRSTSSDASNYSNAKYSLTVKLSVQDPSDSRFTIVVCSETASGNATWRGTDDTSAVTGTITTNDSLGQKSRYNCVLRNTGNKIITTFNVTLKYGVEVTIAVRTFANKTVSLYTGKESKRLTYEQFVPETGASSTTSAGVYYGTYVSPSYNEAISASYTTDILDYSLPTFSTLSIHRCDSNGEANDNGAYCRMDWGVSITPINNQNSKRLTINHPAGTKNYNPLSSYTQAGSLTVAASTESAYDIIFTLKDDLTTVTRTLRLSTAGVIMDWLNGGRGIALGKVAEKQDALEISTDWDLICYKLLLSGTDVAEWMKEMLSRMKAIEQFASNMGSTDQFQVSFYNGNELFDRQWVLSGESAYDPDETPTKEPTNTTTYSFVGWSLQENATTEDPNALNNVTSFRSVYAAYSSSIRYYGVFFYNGSTLLQSITDVNYGGTGVYSGSTPTSSEGTFVGFAPTGKGILGNTTCYAKFYDESEITDSWDEIIAACDDGTFAEKYKLGQYKYLDMGAEGVLQMQCVAMKTDQRSDRNRKAAMTWISKNLLATNHRFNPASTGSYVQESVSKSWKLTNNGSAAWIWESQNSGENVSAYGKWKCVVSGFGSSRGGGMEVRARGRLFDGDTVTVKVNGTTVGSWTNSTINSLNSWRTLYETPDVTVQTTYNIEVTYKTATTNTNPYVEINLFASVIETGAAVKVTNTVNNATTKRVYKYTNATGGVGGWKDSEMRTYLRSLRSLIPENVRAGIKSVYKYTKGVDVYGNYISNQKTTDDVWLPSREELIGNEDNENVGVEYAAQSSSRIKKKGTTATIYYLRTPHLTSYFNCINTNGEGQYWGSDVARGVCLGFCT